MIMARSGDVHAWLESPANIESAARRMVPGICDAFSVGRNRHVRCPLPGHDDERPSFRFDSSKCRFFCSCMDKGDDFLGIVKRCRGLNYITAIREVADVAGISLDEETHNGNGHARRGRPAECPLERLARIKRAPVDSLTTYGATLNDKQVVFPAYGPDGRQCTTFTINPFAKPGTRAAKGLFAKDKPAGLFFPHDSAGNVRPPQPGETWFLVEGVKDAAALHGLGLLAGGLNTTRLNLKFAELFRGVDVVLVPDLDRAGCKGALESAEKLEGIAESVTIVRLPGAIKEKDGDDLRDILKAKDEEVVRNALAHPLTVAEFRRQLDPGPIANYEVVKDDGGEAETSPLPSDLIVRELQSRTDGFPKFANGALFIAKSGRVEWLEKSPALFGWIHQVAGVAWKGGPELLTKAEFFANMGRAAERWEAIEEYPHEPRFPDHFYLRPPVEPGNGEHLRRLLEFFSPETNIDRDLIQAALMSMLWGGPGGARPLFLVTSDGRGHGKTTLVERLADVFGGAITLSTAEPAERIKTRLLSPDGLRRRVALLDNLKTHKLSWGDLEALITCREISGHRMYCGEAERPNSLSWFITINGASLSKDMAQRAVIIRVRKPDYSGTWEADLRSFIEDNREQIIADLIAALRGPRHELSRYTRWGEWEREIVERLPEPGEAQKVIEERRQDVDTDAEEAALVVDAFRSELARLNYDTDRDRVFIPSRIAADVYNAATNDRQKTGAVGAILNQMIEERAFPALVRNRTNAWGRGFVWDPPGADPDATVRRDLDERREG